MGQIPPAAPGSTGPPGQWTDPPRRDAPAEPLTPTERAAVLAEPAALAEPAVAPGGLAAGAQLCGSVLQSGRPIFEAGLALLLLVVLLRTFIAGGYMIETGSMAPCLLGYHRRVTCDSCGWQFAVDGTQGEGLATCPNCCRDGLTLEGLPLNDGDHLLVSRPAYEFSPPLRWEVIVFRNPSRPGQAYVKRLVGLPGERVHLRQGDLYVNDVIAPKPLAVQRGMRILVHDHDHSPPADEPDWQSRWEIETPGAGWDERGGRFLYAPLERQPAIGGEVEEWVGYRHWIRRGGGHRTSVRLDDWPARLPPSALVDTRLQYVGDARSLVATGALSPGLRARLAEQADDEAFTRSLASLFAASHVAPILDQYGYNYGTKSGSSHEVRDLMFAAQVALRGEPGIFAVVLDDGELTCRCEFDTAEQLVRLVDDRTGDLLRQGVLPAGLREGALVEISLWDRQALVAVAGELVFEPWLAPCGRTARGPTPWRPVRFGARRLRAEVSQVKLYRDVFYTSNLGERGSSAVEELGPDEFFVLGDNSPVSKDSRSWSEGTVLNASLLIGKPLILHLPSRRQRVQWRGWQTEIRIPEPSRIRYIR